MGRVSDSIPNLVNGVSQQPPGLRLATQAEEQVNFLSSVVEGLRKRPHTHHLTELLETSPGSVFVHTINRDTDERYVAFFTDGALRVFDIDTFDEKTVTVTEDDGYLDAADPRTSFRAVTVADYTFVTNKSITTAMLANVEEEDDNLTPVRPKEALVNVKAGNYGKTYKITIDGSEAASYSTPNGGSSSDAPNIDTVYIATQLVSDMSGLTGYTVTRYGNAIHISKDTGDFSIAVEDGFNGNAMTCAKGTVQRFSDLPNFGPEGFLVEVAGDQSNSFDNYWVKFEKTDEDDSSGVWRESIAPGLSKSFDAATMPHTLVRDEDGNFTFGQATWDARVVGDDDSAPVPSFVGKSIADVFFHRNRFGVLADENVIMSRAGSFFNFFRSTVTALLDDDPIDVATTHTRVSLLNFAVAFNETLVLFADQTQFNLSARDALTPKTATMPPTTEFENSKRVRPAGLGTEIYFAVDKSQNTSIQEYFVSGSNETKDAAEITAHVPKYIPGNAHKIAVSSNENTICVLTEDDEESLYIYRFLWEKDVKLQSSWSKFTFGTGTKILGADFIQNNLYLFFERGGKVFMEKMDFTPGVVDTPSTYTTFLDRRVDESALVSAVYDAEADETTLTLPYTSSEAVKVVTRLADADQTDPPEGVEATQVSHAGAVVVVEGDYSDAPLYVGVPYSSEYLFSTVYVREQAKGGGYTVVTDGRLTLQYMTLLYSDTGYFRVEVTPQGRATATFEFTGRVMGSDANVTDSPAIETGKFRFPVFSRNDRVNIRIVNDSFLPSAFQSAEWEAMYVAQSQRI